MFMNNLPFLYLWHQIKFLYTILHSSCKKLESAFLFAVLDLSLGGNDGGQALA
jgi:hypothetical protein